MKISFLVSLLILCSCVQDSKQDLNGLWQDAPSPGFSNSYASFQVTGKQVKMLHFFHYKGKPFFETGVGSFENGTLKYKVNVRQTIDDWATSGYHELSLSADGQRLEGFYISSKGERGPLVFTKK